ncbi:DGQHR domain-containing protein [Providencia rettgeri]|uniref:DGQHR domain-containing protein n=1 Tax=Providencia alcalifaciens TaxID=126385 RepID=A0AAW9VFL7_9GAMM|nr:DGQHR domain-containing protein [Providencia rettgeri]MTC36441.1 DGQHR domain-containing protein [Providencia alcalifaciens]NIA76489.1 DGQHR domain-containing protein [Providencia rettgeri]NIA80661.1 DGQHR domain-containing protein [Providencia rettgeri]NIB03918.1 DGQHR domain-containing protein [Providencia rettgeri]NIB08095.1 DGQHR domain-containing protein [Providencia rettgeri]
MKKITTSFLKITQPIGEFYCCVMKARDLYSISYSDVRRLEEEQSEENIHSYLGIQRELNPSRVKKIKEYIGSVDATFPNSIIVAINGRFFEIENNKIVIKFEENQSGKVAKILDGQHRLAGFEGTDFSFISQSGEQVDFEVLVTIFVEADLHTQAQVFTMVNQNQTKVNKSLVYDLESLALARNPSKTAHQIAVILNERKDSPFFRRIKRLGIKTEGIDSEVLTQAAFVENIVKLISKRPSLDRDILLGKKKNFIGIKNMRLPDDNDSSFRALPFRKSFINSDDSTIAIIIYNFFSVVSELWPNSWSSKNKKSVLNKTVGFIALIRLLRDIYNLCVDENKISYGDVLDKSLFHSKLKNIKLDDSYFETIDAVSKSSGYIYKTMKKFIS